MSLLPPLPPRFGAPGSPQPGTVSDWNALGNFLFFLTQYLFNIASAAQTVVNGATSGTATFSQPFQGTSFSMAVIYLDHLVGAASYTFPTTFINPPGTVATSLVAAGIVTSLTTNAVTVTGTNSTGPLLIVGF